MKNKFLIVFIVITIVVELIFSYQYCKEDYKYNNNVVELNELTNEIEQNFGSVDQYPKNLDYAIIDNNNNLLYATKPGLSESLNQAYQNCDTIVDLVVNDKVEGKIIVSNNFQKSVMKNKRIYAAFVLCISVIQVISFIIYYKYIYNNLLKPFKNMEKFASRVSNGNLDIPLNMDKNNNFGAFTEAFDIMRNEIKKSRMAEKAAMESKKELVAKLSHDIKTPIASIKSSSELGMAISNDNKTIGYFQSINNKSDQINALITNLFNSTLEELEELNVNADEIKSTGIIDLINNSDYLNKNNIKNMPNCKVFADKLRLQQIFDNIFANSYKYANTNIETEAFIKDGYLAIAIRDFGNAVLDKELPLLTEKFKRGTNSNNVDGAGLGLYISKELLKKMNGNLEIENSKPGFRTTIYLRII